MKELGDIWLLGIPLVIAFAYFFRRKQGELTHPQIKLSVTVICLILCFYVIYRPLEDIFTAMGIDVSVSFPEPMPHTISFPIGRIIYAVLAPFAPFLEITLMITSMVLSICGKIIEKPSRD